MAEQLHVEVFGDDEEMTFNIAAPEGGQPVELHVQTTSGELSVQATDRDDIQVWLEVTGRAAHQPVVRADWDGRRLDIAPAKSSGVGRVFRNSPGFDVRVEIPERLAGTDRSDLTARLSSASGEITAGRLSGDIRVSTASGDLTLDHLTGRIDGKSASGDIAIESPRGQLRVSTASGDVTLVEAILDRCEITTVSGSLDGTVVLAGTGPYRLNTVSGDAELQLGILSGAGQPDAFILESSSMSGDLKVDGVARKVGRRRWHLGAGTEPAGTIRLTSVSGDASVMVKPATIDGDSGVPTGPWTGGDWPNDRPDDERGTGQDPERGDLSERISASVDSAMGKVDWAGIDATIDHALDTAFRWPRRPEPAPPAAPAAPQRPTPPAPLATGLGDGPATDTAPAATAASGSGTTKRDPEPATEGGEPDQGESAEGESADARRLDILRRIERGELSVEEGMAQLDAMPGPDPVSR